MSAEGGRSGQSLDLAHTSGSAARASRAARLAWWLLPTGLLATSLAYGRLRRRR